MASLSDNLIPEHLQDGAADSLSEEQAPLTSEDIHDSKSLKDLIVGVGALGISTFVHAAILIVLGLFSLTDEILEQFNINEP